MGKSPRAIIGFGIFIGGEHPDRDPPKVPWHIHDDVVYDLDSWLTRDLGHLEDDEDRAEYLAAKRQIEEDFGCQIEMFGEAGAIGDYLLVTDSVRSVEYGPEKVDLPVNDPRTRTRWLNTLGCAMQKLGLPPHLIDEAEMLMGGLYF